MVLWQGILIILGCMATGLLAGLLLVRLLRRNKEKRPSLLNKEADLNKIEEAKVPVDTTLSNVMAKSNGHEDPLELLLKNHKNGINAEKPKPPHWTDVRKREEPLKSELSIEAEKAAQSNLTNILKQEEIVKSELSIKAENAKQPDAADILKQAETVKSELSIEAKNATQPEAADILKQAETVKSELSIETEKAAQPDETDILKREGTVKSELSIKAGKAAQPDETDILKREGTVKSELSIKAGKATQSSVTDVLKREEPLKSQLIIEMETNLAIASKPWTGKLNPFETKCWDSHHGQVDLLFNTHHQELMQLYIDIGLANNIVWLATEINHRTKELDESYTRLCAGIADNIKKILQ